MNFEKSVNVRIAREVRRTLNLVMRKIDTIVNIKLNLISKELEQKQDCYEQKML